MSGGANDISAERALFENIIQGLVVACFQNERPPYGLSGLVDWHFQGAVSRCLRDGSVTGKAGECTYLPIARNGNVYHLFLAGGGHSATPGARAPLPSETIQALSRNLASLKLTKVGLSRADFGNPSPDSLHRHFKGTSLWIGA